MDREGSDEITAGHPPKSRKSSQRRDLITEVASQYITERGFESLSINDLATAAGISVGGMYRYISSKTDLLVMVCQGIYDGLRDELAEIAVSEGTYAARLGEAIEHYLRTCEGNRRQIAMMYREYRRLPPEAQAHYQRREQAIADVFSDLVRSGVRHGAFRHVDATVLAFDIIFLGHLPAFKQWATREAVSGPELRREQVELILSRVRPSGEEPPARR